MIEPTDIRCGNKVLHEGGIKTVCWIHYDCVKLNDFADKFRYEDCYYVPLTVELLRKCGFTVNVWPKEDGCIVYDGRLLVGIFYQKSGIYHYKNNILLKIRWLHQLQNIVYFMEGNELKVAL